jgi:membrane fusion protein
MNVRRQEWMQALARLQDLQSLDMRAQSELKEAQYQLATTRHTRADENDALKSKMLEIDEKLANAEAHRSIDIRAPSDGVVTSIVAHPGQTISAGAPMLKIVPSHASMQAELLAPSSAVGFIREGGRVLMRYSAYPYQKFGGYLGTVAAVSDAAISAEEAKLFLGGAPTKQAGPFFRVIVTPTASLRGFMARNASCLPTWGGGHAARSPKALRDPRTTLRNRSPPMGSKRKSHDAHRPPAASIDDCAAQNPARSGRRSRQCGLPASR